jgi:agmatine deiminase
VPYDESGGHIDNLACFVRPGVVLLSWCENPSDPHYAVSRDAESRLSRAVDAKGRPLQIEKISMPVPMFYAAEEAGGIDRVDLQTVRDINSRLAGSYVNFLIANGAVIAPQFGTDTDEPAREVLTRVFPSREVVMVPGREILLGDGNIHCITQQQPKLLSCSNFNFYSTSDANI